MANSPLSLRSLLIVAAVLQLVWGLVPSASKLVIDEIPVELYISLRWSISGAIFLLILIFSKSLPPLRLQGVFAVGLLGIGGYALASFGTLYGLKIGGVTNFALMGALSPIVTSSLAILVLREKPSWLFYISLPFCVLGLLLLVIGKHQISSWHVAIASSALILSANVLEAIVFVFSRRLKAQFTAVQYLAVAQISAAVFMWGLQLGLLRQTSAITQLSLQGWAAALFVSVVACVLCYLLLYWLLNFIDGHRLALFDGLHTLSACFFGIVFFNEPWNTMMIMGGALILAGLVLGNLPQREKPKATEAAF